MSRAHPFFVLLFAAFIAQVPASAELDGNSLGASYEEILGTWSTGTLHFTCAMFGTDPTLLNLRMQKNFMRSPKLFRLKGIDWQEIPSTEFREAGLTFNPTPLSFQKISWPGLPTLPMRQEMFSSQHRDKNRYFAATEKVEAVFNAEVNFERETITIVNASAFPVTIRFLREKFMEEHGPSVGPEFYPLRPSLELTEKEIAIHEIRVRELQKEIRDVKTDNSLSDITKAFEIQSLEQRLTIPLTFWEGAKERHIRNQKEWARVDQRTAQQRIERDRWIRSFGDIEDTFEHIVPAGALQFSGTCYLSR